MDEGRILLDGPPQAVFCQREALRRAGLDLPVPALLADALRAQFPSLPQTILNEDDCVHAIAEAFALRDQAASGEPPPPAQQQRRNVSLDAAALTVEQLTYRYPNMPKATPPALDDVNLTVAQGELLAVIGHTGSGKSTLVQHLNALLKPSAGTIRLGGKNIWESKATAARARFVVGLCFQYPEYQLFEETVGKDVAFGPHNMGLPEEEIQRRVLEAADFVGLDEALLAKSPFDLSGGE
jgi:ABC-type glutathione transport system ATPase component